MLFRSKMGGGKSRLKVELSPPGGGGKVAVGEIVFIDNAVNPQTGTILVKAQVKNEKEELWPGQFVAGRIILRMEDEAVTLPEGAVQPGQEGPFVFVVEEGRARARNVTVDRQLDGLMVISKGLRGDEQVVVDVPPTLTSGSQVVLATDTGGGKGGKGGKGDKGGKGKGDSEAVGAAKGGGDAKAGREATVDGAKVAPAKEEKAADAGEAKKDGSKGKKAE